MKVFIWGLAGFASMASANKWNMPIPSRGGVFDLQHLSHSFSCPSTGRRNSPTFTVGPDWVIYGLHNTVGQQERNNCDNESYRPTKQMSCTIVYAPPADAHVPQSVIALKTKFIYERRGLNYWINPDRVWADVSSIEQVL